MTIPPKNGKIVHMEHPNDTQKEYSYGNKHCLKQVFTEKLRASGLIHLACKESEISRSTFHRWFKTDEKFAQDVNSAMTEAYNDERLKEKLKAIPAHKKPSILIDCMKAAGDCVDVPKTLSDRDEPVSMFNTDEPITIPRKRVVDINTKINKSMNKAKMDLLEILNTMVKSITTKDLKALKPEKKAYMIRKISEAITAMPTKPTSIYN